MFEDAITELTELLRAETQAALTSIAHTHALAARLGIDLRLPKQPFHTGKRGPSVSASKGKSKPNLAGWLRRATADGTLPIPTKTLIVSDRMVKQGLTSAYIVGVGHPYRATPAGLQYAMSTFKGKKVTRG